MSGYSYAKNGKVYFSHLNPPRKGDMIKFFARLNEKAPKGIRFEPLARCEGGISVFKDGEKAPDFEKSDGREKLLRFDFPKDWPQIVDKNDPLSGFRNDPDTVLEEGWEALRGRPRFKGPKRPLVLSFESHSPDNKWTREEMKIVIETFNEMDFVHKVTCVKWTCKSPT